MFVKLAKTLTVAVAVVATPAMANEGTNTATSAQLSGVIDTQHISAGSANVSQDEFGELFADWEAIENGGRVTSKGNLVAGYQAAKVGVPSLMPLSGSRMSSGYGMRDHPVLGRRANHAGIDLAAPTGTPVYATADGRVERASRWSSYGNIVMIEHGGAMETRYAHLSGFAVSEGDKVRKGQLIGYVGSTGRSTGPHLHYEVRVNGQAVNPVPYMNASIDADDSATAGRGGPE